MATGVLPDIAGQEEHKPTPQESKGMEAWEELTQRQILHWGDVIKGTVVSVDHEGMWVGIGSKSEGIVPLHEMRSVITAAGPSVKSGDEVFVFVIYSENDKGQVVLSIDKAEREKNWSDLAQKLAAGELIDVTVTAYKTGGLLANYRAVRGFIPLSQLSPAFRTTALNPETANSLVGKPMKVKILELDKQRNRLILSESVALREWQEKQKAGFLAELKEGELRKGKVTSIHPFGIFVNLGPADGLIPLSELSWQAPAKVSEGLKIGDEVEVFILKVDNETKRITLSLKRTQPPPWEKLTEKYQVGQLVSGRVTKLVDFGAFVKVDEAIDGLIHISEMANRRIMHPKEVVKRNDVLTLKIVSIEAERHRLRLSLKQAQEEQSVDTDRSER